MSRSAAHLRFAVSVGLVAGVVLGCREAILTLFADAATQEAQYFYLFAAAPVLAWVVLAALLTAVLGLGVGLTRGDTEGVASTVCERLRRLWRGARSGTCNGERCALRT